MTSFVAQVAGLDIDAFFDGASEVIENYISEGVDSFPARSAAAIHASGMKYNGKYWVFTEFCYLS